MLTDEKCFEIDFLFIFRFNGFTYCMAQSKGEISPLFFLGVSLVVYTTLAFLVYRVANMCKSFLFIYLIGKCCNIVENIFTNILLVCKKAGKKFIHVKYLDIFTLKSLT